MKFTPLRYGVISHKILFDKRVSLKAKGLWGYLQGKPGIWDFSAERIAYENSDGISSIKAGLQELESFKFLIRRKYQDHLGHWQIEYILSEGEEIPTVENPSSEIKPTYKERVIKKEILSKTEVLRNVKKEENTPNSYFDGEPSIEPVDDNGDPYQPKWGKKPAKYPNAQKVFSNFPARVGAWDRNRTQLEAAEELFKTKGLEQISKAMVTARRFADDLYCPKIHSPHDLLMKWDKLLDFKQSL